MEQLFPQLLQGGEQKFLSTADLQRGRSHGEERELDQYTAAQEGVEHGWADTGDPGDAHSPDPVPLSRGCSTSKLQETPTHT